MELKEKFETLKHRAEDFWDENGKTITTTLKTGLFVGGVSYLCGYLFGYRDGMTWIKINNLPVKEIEEFIEEVPNEVS